MGEPALSIDPGVKGATRRQRTGTAVRLLRYTVVKALTLFLTTVVGVYLTILIANMGGQVDEIRKSEIRFNVVQSAANDVTLRHLSASEYTAYIDSQVDIRIRERGLDKPFIQRSFSYLWDAISLNLGRAEEIHSDSGSREVRAILTERLFPTLLLFASAQLLIFFASIFIALYLSRRYGSWLDRVILALAPTSATPSWLFGIFLIVLFASVLKVLPYGGMVQAPPPQDTWGYALSVLKHLTLPVLAQVLSSLPYAAYNWRTFFLIYSSEDHVEMAKAKGLSSGQVERRYVLRPTLPTIVTSFSLMLIGLWTGSIILEQVFSWPGLGRLIYQATQLYDTPVVVGSVVLYAYLLGLTMFLLDIVYALVDPRVKVGGGSGA